MTVVVDETPATAVIQELPENGLVPWHIRAGAFAVDILPGVGVITTMGLVCFTVPAHGAWWWVSLSVVGVVTLAMLVNRLLLPVATGWSLGRALCGITVERRDGAAVGPWGLLLRELAHLLDTAPVLVGWLWPLWDSRRCTFADMLLRTEVRRDEQRKRPEAVLRWTAVVVLVAAGLCVAGAAVSYALVYSPERAADRTRAEIATRGPKIVAQMLTYDPKSLNEDFARALSLTTDKYRGKLEEQQNVVQHGHPVINEYHVIDSSVLAASPDGATMLLFMQGRRGELAEQRYISATVRVKFVKVRGQWRVDDLTVLTKPRPPGNEK